jgi:hypothetical protein
MLLLTVTTVVYLCWSKSHFPAEMVRNRQARNVTSILNSTIPIRPLRYDPQQLTCIGQSPMGVKPIDCLSRPDHDENAEKQGARRVATG